ncbi:MAG: glycosyltransferase [Flavobacteriaceae bacterium]|nr:glycosyltransferase [Bacteroidia bacterium]MBT8288579.1 glycosyltransferase [Bacteroidia bacterium]NNF76140.1 glycosyltransferase [Flavobacteriaceae bacterium]NNK72930.1 glycosyltransferase [Flavobacteriaceae bacterium]
MRILLIGEFSRLHNSLKEGLIENGHEVLLVSTHDGFKAFPTDLSYQPRIFNKTGLKWLVKVIYKLSRISLIQLESAWRFYRFLPKLMDYDVVQLINENSIKTHPRLEIWLIKKLINRNNKLFLLSCGADYSSVKYAAEKQFRYSILTPYHENPANKKQFQFVLRYLKPSYKRLHEFLYKNISGVISSDLDYHFPLIDNSKYKGMIPNPINVDKIEFKTSGVSDKLVIFHGINSQNYIKKGNRYFDEALLKIEELYQSKIEIIRTIDLPYKKYLEAYNNCDILFDMVYAYDQGYNALEAMARGKVVFTGAEKEWLEHYGLEADTVAINALPDVDYLVKKLSMLIEEKNLIKTISRNARDFIKEHHHYINIAEQYLKTWKSE